MGSDIFYAVKPLHIAMDSFTFQEKSLKKLYLMCIVRLKQLQMGFFLGDCDQLTSTCSKSTIEALEKGVEYVQI